MTHVRTQIRNAAVVLLGNAASLAGRIHKARRLPLQNADLPAACVYAAAEPERSELLQQDFDVEPGGRSLERSLPLTIDLYARVDEDAPDDPLNALAEEVETALGADPTFGGLAVESHLTSTRIGFADESARPPGVCRLVVAVTYWTREGAPGTAI